MASKFLVKKTNTGYNFLLIATNGQPVGHSQVYASLKSATAGVESIRKASKDAPTENQTVEGFAEEKNPKFVIYADKQGEFRFRLTASNGQNILASEGYTTLAACKNGIASVIKNAAVAEVEVDEGKEVAEEAPKAEAKVAKKAAPKAEKKEEVKAEAKKEVKAEAKPEEKKEAPKAEAKPEPKKEAKKAEKKEIKVASNRLKDKYLKEVKPALMEEFKYESVMQIPALNKVVINIGCGDALQDAKRLEEAVAELGQITGQRPVITKAKKSIATFKVREGQEIGCKVTLRGLRMWDFFDKLVSIALPRVRDFRGVSKNAFDGRGNYTLGVKEQLIFPEIDYDKVQKVRGMDIVIVTTAKKDEEAYTLLELLGMPFHR